MCNLPRNADELFEMIRNTELYNKTFCASIDLLGIKSLIGKANTNLNTRLYNLYSSFHAAYTNYPLSEDIRVCYIGDSIWIIKEFSIEEEMQNNMEDEWRSFCGQIYLMSCDISISENFGENTTLDEPCGIRVIISYGKTYEIYKKKLWPQNNNWFVFTSPNTALNKCFKAESIGENSGKGFLKNHCYSEVWNQVKEYNGYRLQLQSVLQSRDLIEIYKEKYNQLVTASGIKAQLPDETI